MKKIFFMATVLVATTVVFAQYSNETNGATTETNLNQANGIAGINYQDTTKPKKDSLPPKKDSASVKF